MTRLAAVESREVPDPAPHLDHAEIEARNRQAAEQQAKAVQMMTMALQALAQRFVVALSNLFTLLTVASAFWLWIVAMPELTTIKILGLALYATFILLINVFGRRK